MLCILEMQYPNCYRRSLDLNPITMGPMMYFAYKLGAAWSQTADRSDRPEWAWLAERLSEIWAPLIVGCLLCGTTMGLIGFLLSQYYFLGRNSWLLAIQG